MKQAFNVSSIYWIVCKICDMLQPVLHSAITGDVKFSRHKAQGLPFTAKKLYLRFTC